MEIACELRRAASLVLEDEHAGAPSLAVASRGETDLRRTSGGLPQRSDDRLELAKLAAALGEEARPSTEAEIRAAFGAEPGSLGPVGFGDENFVSPTEVLPYTVEYENEPTAAPNSGSGIMTRRISSGTAMSRKAGQPRKDSISPYRVTT